MAETQTSVKEVIPDIGGNFELDQSVIKGIQLLMTILGGC